MLGFQIETTIIPTRRNPEASGTPSAAVVTAVLERGWINDGQKCY